MTKHLKLLFALLLFVSVSKAQLNKIDTAKAKLNLKSSAKKMGQFFVEKDYVQYVKYVHPKIIKLSGGKDEMIDLLKKSLKQTEEQGYTFQNVSIGEPSKIIVTTAELQSVIPQILELKTANGKLVATSYLLGISSDKGNTWYFTDTSGKTLEQMKNMFPELSNELVIPKREQPKLYK